MFRLTIFAPQHLCDPLAGRLFEAGAAGLEERPDGLVVYAADEAQLEVFQAVVEALRADSTLPFAHELATKSEPADDAWQTTWQRALVPEQVTPRWVLRPTHCAPPPQGENTLWFQPDQCFGEGGHPTTRLAATYLERHLTPGQSVFDVGTGSGVLALIAAKAGATPIVAVDNDPISVTAAERNRALNQLEERIEIRQGSAADEESTFDWVVANINTHILVALFPALCRAMKPGGTLLLTGLLIEDEPELLDLARERALTLVSRRHDEPWSLLALSANSNAAPAV